MSVILIMIFGLKLLSAPSKKDTFGTRNYMAMLERVN